MLVKIGHRMFRVLFEADGDLEADGSWGECDKRKGVIRVAAAGRPRDAQAETLLHELVHAFIDDAGADIGEGEEERIAMMLAPRLAAFMRDNPTVVGYIQGMLE